MVQEEEIFKVVCCRVWICPVEHEISSKTRRNVKYRCASLPELIKPVRYGMEVVQDPLLANGVFYKGVPVPGVRVNITYRAHRTVEYRWRGLQNSRKCPVRMIHG